MQKKSSMSVRGNANNQKTKRQWMQLNIIFSTNY